MVNATFVKIITIKAHNMSEIKLTQGEIHSSKGVMKFELYDDDAPIAVANLPVAPAIPLTAN